MDSKLLSNENMSLKAKFLKYMIPSVVSMWVFSLYTMVDGIFVARGVGETALAAVNISMPFVNFIFALSLMFSTGASTIIAVYLGKKDIDSANKIFTMNTVVIIIFSLLIMGGVLLNLEKVATMLGATASTMDYVKHYLGIIVLFNGFFMVSYSLEVIIKTDGFPILATCGVIISAISNVVLDYLFIMVFHWGVMGAAIATGLSQVFSTVFFLIHFFRKNSTLNFSRFKFDFPEFKKIAFIGIPDSTTELSCGIVVMLFNLNIIKYIGEQGVVYYSIINYVNTLVLMTMMGIAQGMQPLVSYYFGAENSTNMKKLFKMSAIAGVIASAAFVVICHLIPDFIVGLFIDPIETAIFTEAIRVLQIYSYAFAFMGINVIVSAFFVSVERPGIAAVVSLGRGFFLILAALYLMIAILGGEGIWYSAILAEGTCMITAIVLYKTKIKAVYKDMKSPKVKKEKLNECY